MLYVYELQVSGTLNGRGLHHHAATPTEEERCLSATRSAARRRCRVSAGDGIRPRRSTACRTCRRKQVASEEALQYILTAPRHCALTRCCAARLSPPLAPQRLPAERASGSS